MDNAQLISLSRQIALQRQMDVVANNLANINTTGFRAEQIMFAEAQMPLASRNDTFGYVDPPLAFTEDWATMHDLSPGSIVQTGNPLDVALQGDGFLAVETPAGERWTRAGALQIDAEGVLVDLDGNPVLSEGGPIKFGSEETDITIAPDGAVLTPEGSKGKLRLVEFDNAQMLAREGDNLFSGGTPLPATSTRVLQGAIERSNVSGVAEMTEMIRVSRAYESLAGIMQQQDETMRAAIQQLGGLSA
jgi:flagellar basal-body rod protein FlgF